MQPKAFPLAPLLIIWEKRLILSLLKLPFTLFWKPIKCPLSLLFSRLNNPNSLSYSPHDLCFRTFTFNHGITEELRLERMSGGHLVVHKACLIDQKCDPLPACFNINQKFTFSVALFSAADPWLNPSWFVLTMGLDCFGRQTPELPRGYQK